MALKMLASEANYVQGVLEDTLEEILETGTFGTLTESVVKSRQRNKEMEDIW